MADRAKTAQTGQIDDLYGLPPAEFTKARNALAKELRRQGDAAAAEEAAAARKPTTAAWAVNQLVRREADPVRELLALGEELREAQGRLVGGGDAGEVLALSERERGLVQRLVERAAEILSAGGARPSEATLDDVRETLHAAAVDEEAAREVAEGRLVKERRAIGFGLGAGAPAPKSSAARGRAGAGKRRPAARATAAERKLAELREKASEAHRAAAEAEDRLGEARRAEKAAARAVRQAEGDARQAARAAERADERVERAQLRADADH